MISINPSPSFFLSLLPYFNSVITSGVIRHRISFSAFSNPLLDIGLPKTFSTANAFETGTGIGTVSRSTDTRSHPLISSFSIPKSVVGHRPSSPCATRGGKGPSPATPAQGGGVLPDAFYARCGTRWKSSLRDPLPPRRRRLGKADVLQRTAGGSHHASP